MKLPTNVRDINYYCKKCPFSLISYTYNITSSLQHVYTRLNKSFLAHFLCPASQFRWNHALSRSVIYITSTSAICSWSLQPLPVFFLKSTQLPVKLKERQELTVHIHVFVFFFVFFLFFFSFLVNEHSFSYRSFLYWQRLRRFSFCFTHLDARTACRFLQRFSLFCFWDVHFFAILACLLLQTLHLLFISRLRRSHFFAVFSSFCFVRRLLRSVPGKTTRRKWT